MKSYRDLPMRFKSNATNVNPSFVKNVTGVTNFKPIMRLESAIAVMPFTAEIVTKWINATTVAKSSVPPVPHC